jgi:two-component system NtrC family sensor kinase
VSEPADRVRILVALPGALGPARLPAPPAGAALRALRSLGPEVEVDAVNTPEGCAAAARRADLLVVATGDPASAAALLAQARAGGPAVVALVEGEGDPAVVEWFRGGAADCVVAAAPEALAAVALEQLRRQREARERRATQRRIANLQRYTENIIQNLNSALLVVDNDGRVTFANGTAAQILGEAGADLRGRSAWDWFRPARGQSPLLARTLSDGARFRGAEALLLRPDGQAVPIGMSCAPLVDGDGTRLGAVAIFQDLTEITLLQRQVIQSEKMASIGQLAAGVAHEINNPMGFIHANLFQMAEYLSDMRRLWSQVGALRKAAELGSAAEVRRAAEELDGVARELDAEYVLEDFAKAIRESQEGSERIRHIVRDLRDFSRQDGDELVPSDINQCLDSTANIVWSMMKHSVVLRKRYGDLPRLPCHPMQLKQVFMNLLVNAYQAIEERVGGTGERGEIELATERRGDSVVVSVSDTGTGIPVEQLHLIFDPFFTTKRVGEGVGLGLSIAFDIVRRHGGTLRAANRTPHGASFEVLLPIGGPPARDPA